MAGAMRIDHLLLRNPPKSPAVDRARVARAPVSRKRPVPKRQPTQPPDLLVKTSSVSPVSGISPESDRFSWELDKDEVASIRHRKRKSPIDEEAFTTPRSTRLPRFSVNVFHSEPANTYPIPNEGVVPRMVKYCEHNSSVVMFSLTTTADTQVWAQQHGRALAFEGHPKPYLSLVFPYALQRPVLFEGIIALARAFWLLQERIAPLTDTALAYHRANAFAGLRQRLASDTTCSDDTTILTIAALTTIDVGDQMTRRG